MFCVTFLAFLNKKAIDKYRFRSQPKEHRESRTLKGSAEEILSGEGASKGK
jgi:hypothetical protein